MMKKVMLILCLMVLSYANSFAYEEVIAQLENPQGKSYFAYNKLESKGKDPGWQDGGSNDVIIEIFINDGNLDVRLADPTNKRKSALAQGGKVIKFDASNDEATILVVYPTETLEIYTLYNDKEGNKKFIMTQVKSGKDALFTQSSIFTGSCKFIYFDKFPE